MPVRTLDIIREPITRIAGGVIESSRTIPVYSGITGRDITGRMIGEGDTSTPATPAQLEAISRSALTNAGRFVSPYANQATSVSPTEPQSTFYGVDNPFLVLSDVFRNIFGSGGDVGQQKQVGQALVPVTSTSGGGASNLILIVVIIGIVGFAYYYYKKRQH